LNQINAHDFPYTDEKCLPMKIAEIWRNPVKSMGGDKLDRQMLGSVGITGDREVHAEDAHEHYITARTHPQRLGHHARLDSSGGPTVDGLHWTDPQVLQHVVDIVGPGAHLALDDSADRFDVSPSWLQPMEPSRPSVVTEDASSPQHRH